ncbi:MAG: aconitate hydratase AcnA, partial [Candidatus Omnitrophica bacterium]|nr:aconitate hydratase AcnA [Candidatus Omnitrophota bacterium]
LEKVKESFEKGLSEYREVKGQRSKAKGEVSDGSVVIAAITSCTNTSNPAVMLAAGLVAKKALERGLKVKPWVKTSLAPGSKVVIEYLKASGLLQSLEAQRFHLVGYGCTTCIGNSGPLPEPVAKAVKENDLYVAAVLSGNRNFEGRVHPQVRANYLASPPLVVAYARAGTMETDLTKDSLGSASSGKPVYLRDIWPGNKEVSEVMKGINAGMFQKQYADVFQGDEEWSSLKISAEDCYRWEEISTYIRRPPYFDGMAQQPVPLKEISNARVLAVLGDSITTDHISPAGSIAKESPAGKYLIEHGIEPKDFNSYGARRGNHEVMIRGTFANIRLKNLLAPGTEGGWTRHLPDGEKMTIYDASVKYQEEKNPLIILAGKEYGSGSSRDWAAKGPALLGVKAVIAESFERIHRSNLIGMGVLPLQFLLNENRETLQLTGEEIYSIEGIASGLTAGKKLIVHVHSKEGDKTFQALCRIDTPRELDYYRHGGILRYVLRGLLK